MKSVYKIICCLCFCIWVLGLIGCTGYLVYYGEYMFAVVSFLVAMMALPFIASCLQYMDKE